MIMPKTTCLLAVLSTILIQNMDAPTSCWAQAVTEINQTGQLADLSGLAWVEGDKFIAVHDAKTDAAEMLKPRVAQLELPRDLRGIVHTDLHFTFNGTTPNDLESIAKIPGSTEFLLAESGDSMQDSSVQRIYKAKLQNGQLKIVSQTQWPVKITNVEATAIAKLGDTYVFVFAERADNKPATELSWIILNPNTMKFDTQVSRITFKSPDTDRFNRVIVGLDIDQKGSIYSVSAFDAESADLPNPDNGPYASGVYEIGKIGLINNVPTIELYPEPRERALVDGFKIESIAVRSAKGNQRTQIFFGTDDENYGGVLRQVTP